MSRLIFMLEEHSMKVLLEGLLPRLFPELAFLCIAHEGKSDLEKSLTRKLRAWTTPGDRFVVIRDNDGGDCRALKASLVALCEAAGRSDSLIRIACQELEAWYFGQPAAMAAALDDESLRTIGARARYRNPDAILRPSHELARLCRNFQKVGSARKMAKHLSPIDNTSSSFGALINGIARVSGRRILSDERASGPQMQ